MGLQVTMNDIVLVQELQTASDIERGERRAKSHLHTTPDGRMYRNDLGAFGSWGDVRSESRARSTPSLFGRSNRPLRVEPRHRPAASSR